MKGASYPYSSVFQARFALDFLSFSGEFRTESAQRVSRVAIARENRRVEM